MVLNCHFKHREAIPSVKAVEHIPGNNIPAINIDDCGKIHKPFGQRNVCYVDFPQLVGSFYFYPPYQIRPNIFCMTQFAQVPPVSYTHLRAHETKANLVCRLLLEKKKKKNKNTKYNNLTY